MPLVVWDESISVHIPHIDDQHQRLIDWLNSLHEAIENGEGEQAVASVLHKLHDYVADHFAQEEQLMLSCEFPGLAKHRAEHVFFVRRLQEIRNESNGGTAISANIYEFLADWLICHIKGTDQKYSRHILEKRQKAAEKQNESTAASETAGQEDEARRAKIEAIRKQLAEGSYQISGKAVAGKILDVIKG